MVQSLAEVNPLTWRNFLDFRTLFNSRSRRYRMMLNISFSWFGQFSGNNVASYYLPYLVANVGITSTNTQLLLNVVYAVSGWIPAMIGARLHDVVGRRKMLMGVTLGMSICLAITAGTASGYVHTGSRISSSASIAFIYIFGAIFALAMTSMQPIYPAEVLSNEMRAKGMTIYQLTAGVASFVNTFAAPVALKNVSLALFDLTSFLLQRFHVPSGLRGPPYHVTAIWLYDSPQIPYTRSSFGSTPSLPFGISLNSVSFTSFTSRPKAAHWKSLTISLKRAIHEKRALRRFR